MDSVLLLGGGSSYGRHHNVRVQRHFGVDVLLLQGQRNFTGAEIVVLNWWAAIGTAGKTLT
jgi:hypothetical protein